MVYGIANKTIKLFLFTTNLLIFIFGGLLFSFSLWANLDRNFASHLHDFTQKIKMYNELVDKVATYQSSLWILVAIGALLMVVGFLGCCGASCENIFLLTLFSIVLIALSLIEAYVLIALFTNKDVLLDDLQGALAKSSETPEGRQNLKPIEDLLNCCGATAKTRLLYVNEGLCAGELARTEDCFNVLSSKIDLMGATIVKFGLLLLLLQLTSVFFSSLLCKAFRDYYSPVGYTSTYYRD
ncbi:unnamed protein product [Meloidogyne enterolobii]|uniref:Tetraspanin n=2 Tax=Meloidogyne enterolobii TaxID=390850 RepID=A0A6V7U360_MELEN|nr:unnamed protein product [Meloidogyne enterolobii]